MESSRGRDIPGDHNFNVIRGLFAKQSENWPEYIHGHFERVMDYCFKFILDVLRYSVAGSSEIADIIMEHHLKEALQQRRVEVVTEMSTLR